MENLKENPTCPIHKTELEWREGRYGEFWGCRAYATEGCKYVFKPLKPTEPTVANVGKATSVAPIMEKIKVINGKMSELQTLWNELEKLL